MADKPIPKWVEKSERDDPEKIIARLKAALVAAGVHPDMVEKIAHNDGDEAS